MRLQAAFRYLCDAPACILSPPAGDVVLDRCIYGHMKKFNLHAAVVMPDHVHSILTPLTDMKRRRIYPLYEILRTLKSCSAKSCSARAINTQTRHEGRLWQEESFDHVLRSSESLDAKVAYLLANPVRKGLARVPEEYPWIWRSVRSYAPPGGPKGRPYIAV